MGASTSLSTSVASFLRFKRLLGAKRFAPNQLHFIRQTERGPVVHSLHLASLMLIEPASRDICILCFNGELSAALRTSPCLNGTKQRGANAQSTDVG
jgi:hypothetical protein